MEIERDVIWLPSSTRHYLYVAEVKNHLQFKSGPTKVGITNNTSRRLGEHQFNLMGAPVELLRSFQFLGPKKAREMERAVHNHFPRYSKHESREVVDAPAASVIAFIEAEMAAAA